MGFLLSIITISEATPMAKACGVVLFVGRMATLFAAAIFAKSPKFAISLSGACLSHNCEQNQGWYRKQQHDT